jgi:hypothetical protein
MKGSPLLRTAIVAIVLAALFWPVWKITHPPSGRPAPTVVSPESEQPTSLHATILLRGAPEPSSCSVTQAGKVILSEKDRTGPGEFRTEADLTQGTDLLVSATWKDGNPHALHLEVAPRDSAMRERDYWTGATLEDAFPMTDSEPKRP